jgi:hypothetical protein
MLWIRLIGSHIDSTLSDGQTRLSLSFGRKWKLGEKPLMEETDEKEAVGNGFEIGDSDANIGVKFRF